MSETLCPRCGAVALRGNAFCHRCRTRLREVAAAAAIPPESLPTDRRRRRRWLVWLAVTLVALPALIASGLSGADWLVRRQRGSESAALGELHALVRAELRYSQSNAGHFDRLDCLCAPARCLPRYPAAGGVFLDGAPCRAGVRGGYRFVFHPGPPPAPGTADERRLSPSSVAAFALTAVPEAGESRLRSFCADSSARLCALRSTTAVELAQGVCPLDCVDLR